MDQEEEANPNETRLANGFASLVESAESKLRRQKEERLKPLQLTLNPEQADPSLLPAAQDHRCAMAEMQATQTPRRKLPKVAGWQLKCPAFSTVQLEDDELDNQADRGPNVGAPNESCARADYEWSFQDADQVGRKLERRRATQPAVCGADRSHWLAADFSNNNNNNGEQSSRSASHTKEKPDENGFTLGQRAVLRRVSDCGGGGGGGARFLGRPKEMTNRVLGGTAQGGAAGEQMNTNGSGLDKRRPRDKDKNDGRPQLSSEWSAREPSPSASLSAKLLAPGAQSARSSSGGGGGGDADERSAHSKSMFADSNNMRQSAPLANERGPRQLIESYDGVRPPRSIVSCLTTASRPAYRPQSERLEPEPGDESERDDGPTPTNDPIWAPASRNNCNKSGDTAARRASAAAATKCQRQRNQEGANADARRQQQQSDSNQRFCDSFKVSSSSPPNGGSAAVKWTSGLQLEQRKRHSEDVGAQVRGQSEIVGGERRHSANVFDLGLAKRLMNKCHINQPLGALGSPAADNRGANLRVVPPPPPAGSRLREAEVGGDSASNMNGGGGGAASSLAPYRLAARAIETMQATAGRVAAAGQQRNQQQQQQQQQQLTNGAPPEWQTPHVGQRRHSTYMLPLLLLTKRQDTSESDDDDDDSDEDDEHDDGDGPADAAEGEPRVRVRRQRAREETLGARAKLICNLPNSASSPSALSTPTNADSAGGCGGLCCSQEAQLERLSRENRQLASINKQAESSRGIEANGLSDQCSGKPQRQQQQQQQKSNIEQQQQVILRHRIGSNPLERANVAHANNGQANSQKQQEAQQLIGQPAVQNGRFGPKVAEEQRSGSFRMPRRSLASNQASKTNSSKSSGQKQAVNSLGSRRLSMGVGGSFPLRPPRDHPQLIETQQSGQEPVYEPLIPESGFKIVVMGTSGSGKTAIIQRFLYGTFSARHLPTVEDTYFIEFPYRKQLINIAVSDTSGTYQFPAMKKLAINSGDAFILVYSVDDPQSFDDLEQLRQTILDEREQAYLDSINASAGGHNNNNDHQHHHPNHHHHPQASSSTSSSTSSVGSSSWALSSPGDGGGATGPSSLTSTDGAHLQHNQLYPLSSSIGSNQLSQQQQQQQQHLSPGAESAHQGADLSPSRHWSLAALFGNHHHQQNHNQSSNCNGPSAAMHTANQILHQQLFSSALNTTNHNQPSGGGGGGQPLNGAVRTASSLNSSLCSSNASASTSCSSSAENSRRSSISAAEAALRTRRTRRPPMVIVANKHDLPRDRHQVNSDEMEALVVIDWNNGFVRASAALNWNIDEIFQQVLKQARQPPTLTEAIVSKRRKSLPPKLPHP